jgi:D-glycero-D-manno-heptose 1,7-bisphosphate phosphatase
LKKPAVFLDRDGTINEQMGYINHVSRFVLLPMAAGAIRSLNESGYLTIVLSNQSGVARGYYPYELVDEVNSRMKELLGEKGALIDGIFFCPHYPKGSVPQYSIECNCRKPSPGMIETACSCFEIDLSNSYMIGDRVDDIKMARSAGIKGVLVKTGYGRGEVQHVLPHSGIQPDFIAEDILDAVIWIRARAGKNAEGK